MFVDIQVVQCFAESGQFDKIILYSKKVGYTPDYLFHLRQVLRVNPEQGVKFAQMLISDDNAEPLADLEQVGSCAFTSHSLLTHCSLYCCRS